MKGPKATAEQRERRRSANQAAFWNAKQAAAQTPMERVSVWYDACRMRAAHAENAGDSSVAESLASYLHDFFVSHSPSRTSSSSRAERP